MKVLLWLCLFFNHLPSPYSSTCSCSCCRFQNQTRGDASPFCALVAKDQLFMSSYRTQEQSCSDLCDRNTTDKVITNVNGTQIDYQRFCYDECGPGPSSAIGSTCVEKAASGHNLAHKLHKHAAMAVIHHHRHRHHKEKQTTQIAHLQRLVSMKTAAGSEPWPSMKDEYSAIGLRAEQESTQAAKDAAKSTKSAGANAKVASTNAKIAPALIASVSAAERSARAARSVEKKAVEKVKEVQQATAQAAHDIIDEVLDEVRDQAHAEAKVEAQKAAKALMEKMLKEIPAAAKAASAPYIAAMNRAHAYAAKYASLGDTWAGKSVGLQMSAGLLLGQANSWQALGDTGKAQGMFQQAHQMTDLAVAFSAKAGSLYAAGVEVASHDGEWVAEADAAAYHATVMRNPDAPPPAVYGGR